MYGITPLMLAVQYAQIPEVISELIKAGAEVNARDSNGKKAIDYAKENNALNHTNVYWQLHDASIE
jgi:ankyrin repeat protein